MRKKRIVNRKRKTKRPTKSVGGKMASDPAPKDDGDVEIVARAGRLLCERARWMPDDRLLIGSAHVFRAVWAMLCTRDDRARKTMREIERLCVNYRQGGGSDAWVEFVRKAAKGVDEDEFRRLLERDEWLLWELPSREKLDRSPNLAKLVRLAEHAWRVPVEGLPDRCPTETGIANDDPVWTAATAFMVSVRLLFPDVPKAAESDFAGCLTKVAETWLRESKRARWDGRRLKTARLVVCGLTAVGLDRKEAENWMNGLPYELQDK